MGSCLTELAICLGHGTYCCHIGGLGYHKHISTSSNIASVYTVTWCFVLLHCFILKGAGDAFIGALSYYLAVHPLLPFEKITERAGLIASCSVTAMGTQASYQVDRLEKDLFTS